MKPLISIIIPVYNHADALQQALFSIAKQTHKNVEVIVVDDGSGTPVEISPPIRGSERGSLVKHASDFSADPTPAYRQAGNPPLIGEEIRVVHQEHAGAPAARNRGMQEAKGEFVIFWDADVVAEPLMLEKMLQALEVHPDASFVYCNLYFGKRKMPAQEFEPVVLKQKNYIHSTSLIRRAAVIPWDESLKRFQDWDLWLTMAEQGKKGIWIPEYLFHVEPRKQGMSSWLPSFAYQNPWRFLPGIRGRVKAFEAAREVIRQKHHLN